jgi:hypothetical protein
MLPLCRALVYLYPAPFRREYGEEMVGVLLEVHQGYARKSKPMQIVLGFHEAGGLLYGALREHLRAITGSYRSAMFSPRRFHMRSEFRFPKAAVTLMIIILIAVVMAIEKARAISLSLPPTSSVVGPIRPEQFTTVTTLLTALAGACVAGVIGWAILFALRRSGMHRLSEVKPTSGQRQSVSLTK